MWLKELLKLRAFQVEMRAETKCITTTNKSGAGKIKKYKCGLPFWETTF